jgi:formate-dependent phosphoribosylglycinamide formyltransferase (GAR transformylase)
VNVIFVEPAFPDNQRQFVRALHGIGARVTGVGERPYDWLDDETKGRLVAYEQVSSVTDEGALHAAVRRVQGREWVDRLEATVEAHVLPAARVREACTIPGISTRTAYLCRDKVAMKEVLRDAGVSCAASTAVASVREAKEFAAAVGFPLVVKVLSTGTIIHQIIGQVVENGMAKALVLKARRPPPVTRTRGRMVLGGNRVKS